MLLERRELASATTPRAAGLIRLLSSKQGQTALKSCTRESIGKLREKLGEPLGLHEVGGGLLVASSVASARKLEDLEQLAIEHEEDFSWIDRSEAEELVPWLDGSKVRKFTLLPNESFIDPYLLAASYAKESRQHGAVLKTECEVKGLLKIGHQITRVRTREGSISAGCFIDAAGFRGEK